MGIDPSFDYDEQIEDQHPEEFVTDEEYWDAVTEDTVHCHTCGASMQVGDSECFLCGDHSYCCDHIQEAVMQLEKRLQEARLLLFKCWKAGHKEGWQDGETNTDVFDQVNNFLTDEIGPHWGSKLQFEDERQST